MEKKLVSMAIEKSEADKLYGQPTVMADAPKYPYGLRLSLDSVALDKLGVDKLPGVGEKLMLHAVVEVCCVSAYDSKDGGLKKSIDLQITDLEIESYKEEKEESAGQEKQEMLQNKGALPSTFYAASPEYKA